MKRTYRTQKVFSYKSGIVYFFFILNFLFFEQHSFAQGVWELQYPKPTSENMSSIYCLPGTTIAWAVGDYGTIIKTYDGNSWVKLNTGISSWLNCVYFYNENLGWAAGENSIIRTDNGGITWKKQLSGITDTTFFIRKIQFVNKDIGFAVGHYIYSNKSTFLKTLDGGKNWVSIDLQGHNIWNLFFINSQVGWMADKYSGSILKTIDGGVNWVEYVINGTGLGCNGLYFIDANIGWNVEYKTIYKTLDGGKTWTSQYIDVGLLYDIFMLNKNTGWCVGQDGKILKTLDGGSNWIPQSSGISKSLENVCFSNTQIGWAVGMGGTILSSSDGGITWRYISMGYPFNLNDINFVDANIGFAAGGDEYTANTGIILKTVNGGNTWTPLLAGSSDKFTSVFFINPDNGWVVGYNGLIMKTSNGGSSWTNQTSSVTGRLYRVYFRNANLGWIVGSGGIVLKTTNGGTTWSKNTITSKDLYDVYFADDQTGFACGYDGFYKTIDGGTNWNKIRYFEQASSICFVDKNSGWLSGTYGSIYKTTDGGQTWSGIFFRTNVILQGIFFADKNNGWVVGSEGNYNDIRIYTTIDGGATWKVENSGTSNGLNKVTFRDRNNGWIVGFGGTILHYTNYTPTIQASSIKTNIITYNSIDVSWIRGNGNQCALFAKQTNSENCLPDVNVTYLPNAVFGKGDEIGSSGWYCVYNGTDTTVTITGLQANTTYTFRVCEYNYSPDFTHYNNSSVLNNPITVKTLIALPEITKQPENIAQCETSDAVFLVSAIGESMTYKWQRNTGYGWTDLANSENYSGCTTNTLTILKIANALNGAQFRCLVHNSTGDITTNPAILTVNPLPSSAGAVSGSGSVCKGQTALNYEVNTISGANSYIWTFPSGVSGASTTKSIVLNIGENAVSGKITVRGSNSCGLGNISNFDLNIKTIPNSSGLISGLDNVCKGQTNVLYQINEIPDVTDYQWTLPDGSIMSSQNNNILVNFNIQPSGIIKLTPHNSCGNGQSSTKTVSVINPPEITGINFNGDAKICEGDSLKLEVDYNKTYKYTWKLDEVTLNNPENFLYAKSQGLYSLGVGIGECKSTPTSLRIDKSVGPPIPEIYLKGKKVWYIGCSVKSGVTYIWYKNGVEIPNSNKQIIVPKPAEGTYYVKLKNSSVCLSRSVDVKIPDDFGTGKFKNLEYLAENEDINSGIIIYPNPSQGKFSLMFESEYTGKLFIIIKDISGKTLHQFYADKSESFYTVELDLSKAGTGIYFIEINANDKKMINKIVIK